MQLHLQDLNLDNVDALEGLKLNIQVVLLQLTVQKLCLQRYTTASCTVKFGGRSQCISHCYCVLGSDISAASMAHARGFTQTALLQTLLQRNVTANSHYVQVTVDVHCVEQTSVISLARTSLALGTV